MFGKVMSLPDELMTHYFILCTDVPEEEVYALERDWKAGRINPRDVKRRLAREIVALYHSAEAPNRRTSSLCASSRNAMLPTDAPEVPTPCLAD